jgi:hypothetical protein
MSGFYACFIGKKSSRCSVVSQQGGAGAQTEPRVFATTRWSLILSAANSDADGQKAREALPEVQLATDGEQFSHEMP